MRILFIDPPGMQKPLKNKPGNGLNLAVATLAPVLLNHGHQVCLFDMANHYECRSIEFIRNSLSVYKPDIIGISILNAQYERAVTVIKRLRTITSLPIIVGGAEITAVEHKIFHDTDYAVDISVLGEGEESLVKIIECIQGNQVAELEKINGIIINRDRKLIKTGSPQINENINVYPYPTFDVFGVKNIKTYMTVASRGCPFNCSFCFKYQGDTWRCRLPENIVGELLTARERYHFDVVRFEDANFNLKPEWTHSACDAIMKSDLYGIHWEAGLRADKIDKALCKHMVDAGCQKVFIGVESLDPEVFKLIKKGETIDQIKKGVKIAQEYFKQVQLFIVIGLPGDTKKRALHTFREAMKLGNVTISCSLAVPYSSTRLETWVNENATVHGSSYDSFTRGTSAYYSGVSFETKDFTKKDRLKVFHKYHINSNKYITKSKYRFLTPFVWMKDALYHNPLNIHRHMLNICVRVINEFSDIMKLSRKDAPKQDVDYARIPDGSWWIG